MVTLAKSQGIYLRTQLEALGENYGALRDYLMIDGGVYLDIAKTNAEAVRGIQPKISIWSYGGEVMGDSGLSGNGGAMKETNVEAVRGIQLKISIWSNGGEAMGDSGLSGNGGAMKETNAEAVWGIQPKISIWSNGGEAMDDSGLSGNGGAMKEMAALYKMLPPAREDLDTI